MISEVSRDTEDWINYTLQYIHIENSYFKF